MIAGGNASVSGTGGHVTLRPGNGANDGSVQILDASDASPRIEVTGAGVVNVVGRDNTEIGANGTDVTIAGGAGSSSNGNGGSVVISPGSGATHGAVHITDAIDDSPRVTVTSTGAVAMSARSTATNGESISVIAGNGGGYGSGGNIELKPGNGLTPGEVVVYDSFTSQPRMKVDGSGNVALNAAAGSKLALGQGGHEAFVIAEDGTVTLTSADGGQSGRDVRISAGNGTDVAGSVYFSPGVDGNIVLQDSSGEEVIRVTGDGSIHMRQNIFVGDAQLIANGAAPALHVDTETHNVGIGTLSPDFDLDVNGDARVTGSLTVDTDSLYVDAANNKVGIGTLSPSASLDVEARGLTGNLLDMVELSNTAPGTAGTRTAIVFKQAFTEPNGNTGSPRNSGRVTVGTEEDWVGASTRNSYMAFETSFEGVVEEQVIIGSSGAMQTKGDLVVGGADMTGQRSFTVESHDDNAKMLLISGNASYASTLTFEDGVNTATVGKEGADLKIRVDGAERAVFGADGTISFDASADAEFVASQGGEPRFRTQTTGSVTVSSKASQPVAITGSSAVMVESTGGPVELISQGNDATVDISGAFGATIQSLANDVDISAASQIILTASAGTIIFDGESAVEISSTVGDVALVAATAMNLASNSSTSVVATGAISFSSTGSNLSATTLQSTGNMSLTSTEASIAISAHDGVKLESAAGDVRLRASGNYGSVGIYGETAINITSDTAGVDFSAAGTARFSAGTTMDISAAGNAGIVSSAGVVNISAAAQLSLESSNSTVDIVGAQSVTMLSVGGDITLDAAASISMTAAGPTQVTSASIGISASAGGVDITAAGANGTVKFAGESGISLNAQGSGIELTAGQSIIATAAAGDVEMVANSIAVQSSSVEVVASTDVTLNAFDNLALVGVSGVNLSSSSGPVALKSHGEGSRVQITGQSGVNIVAESSDVQVTANSSVTMLAQHGNLAIEGHSGISMSTVDGPIEISVDDTCQGSGCGLSMVGDSSVTLATRSADVGISAASAIEVAAVSGAVTLNGSAGVSLHSTTGNVNISSSTGQVIMGGIGGVSLQSLARITAQASTSLELLSAGTMSATAANSVTVESVDSSVNVHANTDVNITAGDKVWLSGVNGISMDAHDSDVVIQSHSLGKVSLMGNSGVAITSSGGNVSLGASANVKVAADGKIAMNAEGDVAMYSTGANVGITSPAGAVNLSGGTGISLEAIDELNVYADELAFSAMTVELSGSSGVSVDSEFAINLTATDAVQMTSTGGDVIVTGGSDVTVEATTGDVSFDAAESLSLRGQTVSLTSMQANLSLTAANSLNIDVGGQATVISQENMFLASESGYISVQASQAMYLNSTG
eukprot:COSAG05_NODE_1424_length_4925_cov_3.474720_1_plen_1362_part_10